MILREEKISCQLVQIIKDDGKADRLQGVREESSISTPESVGDRGGVSADRERPAPSPFEVFTAAAFNSPQVHASEESGAERKPGLRDYMQGYVLICEWKRRYAPGSERIEQIREILNGANIAINESEKTSVEQIEAAVVSEIRKKITLCTPDSFMIRLAYMCCIQLSCSFGYILRLISVSTCATILKIQGRIFVLRIIMGLEIDTKVAQVHAQYTKNLERVEELVSFVKKMHRRYLSVSTNKDQLSTFLSCAANCGADALIAMQDPSPLISPDGETNTPRTSYIKRLQQMVAECIKREEKECADLDVHYFAYLEKHKQHVKTRFDFPPEILPKKETPQTALAKIKKITLKIRKSVGHASKIFTDLSKASGTIKNKKLASVSQISFFKEVLSISAKETLSQYPPTSEEPGYTDSLVSSAELLPVLSYFYPSDLSFYLGYLLHKHPAHLHLPSTNICYIYFTLATRVFFLKEETELAVIHRLIEPVEKFQKKLRDNRKLHAVSQKLEKRLKQSHLPYLFTTSPRKLLDEALEAVQTALTLLSQPACIEETLSKIAILNKLYELLENSAVSKTKLKQHLENLASLKKKKEQRTTLQLETERGREKESKKEPDNSATNYSAILDEVESLWKDQEDSHL